METEPLKQRYTVQLADNRVKWMKPIAALCPTQDAEDKRVCKVISDTSY